MKFLSGGDMVNLNIEAGGDGNFNIDSMNKIKVLFKTGQTSKSNHPFQIASEYAFHAKTQNMFNSFNDETAWAMAKLFLEINGISIQNHMNVMSFNLDALNVINGFSNGTKFTDDLILVLEMYC